ncbi:hypothetical protein [Lapillicoccus sp.]|uniref:hypothetical protein n=1 Tax=Lapillicoccus sp. TaxID=1909287 RepID=UPI0025F3B9E4|nr:hypothetical protein [Lapillicoccus sp.]
MIPASTPATIHWADAAAWIAAIVATTARPAHIVLTNGIRAKTLPIPVATPQRS